MKIIIILPLLFLAVACTPKSGVDEKKVATEAFVHCDFQTAIARAELAIKHSDGNPAIAIPSLLIIGKSSEILKISSSAYDDIVTLAPDNFPSVNEVQQAANAFMKSLAKMAPEKVAACPQLQ